LSHTNTTKLGLVKPTPGTAEPVNVLTQLDDNWDKIDSAMGNGIFTSVTNPTGGNRFNGQIIYETDTTLWKMWDGTNWIIIGQNLYQAYSPGFSGFTPGNGTFDAKYQQGPGRRVHAYGTFVFGSTSSVSGNIVIGIPIASLAAGPGQSHIGDAFAIRASTVNDTLGGCELASTTGFNVVSRTDGIWNATSPSAWVTGNELRWNVTYERAGA
jgi:hypothetical protein